jgi:predicted O-methyltransferase YrrM
MAAAVPAPTLAQEYQARLREDSGIKDEMPLLLSYAAGYRFCRVLELGVRSGRSTSAFLAAAARTGGHVWSVDLARPAVPAWWAETRFWTFRQADDLNVTPELEGWPVSYHVLFVDTSHLELHTLGELRRFVPYVAPGGVVLCHDTKLPGGQVAQALDTFCAEYGHIARVLPWQPGLTVTPGPLSWGEEGGRRGLGVIHAPNGLQWYVETPRQEVVAVEEELAAAEAELDALSDAARAAYRAWRALADAQNAKATQVRDLRAQAREGET